MIALLSAVIIDYQIHSKLNATGEKVNIIWQAIPYFLIGTGEIFTFTTVYDAAFTIAPKEQKGLASTINLFFITELPNFISMALCNAYTFWFATATGVEAYTNSKVYNYL